MNLSVYKKISIGGFELKKLELDGETIWERKANNLVPTSIDADGSVYEGNGYIDGYRLGSSGSLSSQADTVTTGFIKCKSTDVIRMYGCDFKPPVVNQYCYLAFYDQSFTLLGSINCYVQTANASGYNNVARGNVSRAVETQTLPTVNNGVTTFDHYTFNADADKVAYFRVNGIGSGANMVVTVNEEIYP